MRIFFLIIFILSFTKGYNQEIINTYEIKKPITKESIITNWLQSLPDSITTYIYREVELENRNGKIVQIGDVDDWTVQLYKIDVRNGYIASNGYLPGVGTYSPEEQFTIFRKADGKYLFAYHFLDEYDKVESKIRFFTLDKTTLFELNPREILPDITIWNFINLNNYNNLKIDYPQIDELLEKMLIVYYLPQTGTSIQVGVCTLSLNEFSNTYRSLKDKIEALIGTEWKINGHKFFGNIELKWNSQNAKFER